MAQDEIMDDDALTTTQEEENEAREVDLEGEEEKKVDLTAFDRDAPNLVEFFDESEEGKKFLEDLGRQVVDDFDRAWDSGETYRAKREENYRILTGFLQAKQFPFDGCANAHAPLMLERILRVSSNLFAEIFASNETVFNVAPTGPDDDMAAMILTRHGNWQIKNQMPDFLRQQHRGLLEFSAVGSVFCHSYYDSTYGRNKHDILTCEEFVIPYVWTTVEPDLCDVPYKIKILRKYRHELEALSEEWENVEKVLEGEPPPQNEDPDMVVRETAAQHEGILPADDDPRAPFKFYQYDGWCKFPQTDKQRPVTIIVDNRTQAVLKLTIREEEDWRDKARYNRELMDWQQWTADYQAHQQLQAQELQIRQRLAMPDIPPDESELLLSQLEAYRMPPPEPLPWMKTPEHATRGPDPIKRVPMEMYSHGVCIENPNGSMGLSYGTILADENRMADEALNRFYDAATLANCYSLMIPESLNIEGGTIPFGPGKVTRVRGVSGTDLRQSLVELRPSPANTQLVDMARMAHDWGDGVTVAGIVAGEPGKSGETYRGVSMRLERATKQLSVAGMKYLDFLTNILRNNAKLNALFLPDNEVVEVVNDLGIKDLAVVGKKLYERDYKVTFTADVRFASQAQKISEADEVVQMVGSLPPLQSNPGFVYAAIKDALIARGKHHLVPLLGPPPPPPQVPMGTQPQQQGPTPNGGPPPQGGGGGGAPTPAEAPAVPTGAAKGGVPGPQPGPEVQP
jgi:hypothetical protein